MMDSEIFKAYDVRGFYPGQVNADVAYAVGRALVEFLRRHKKPAKEIAVGMDMRIGSGELHEAVIRGINDAGADVADLGLCGTDMLYFAVGYYGCSAGVMVTASHNPKNYNGFKFCGKGAEGLSSENGLFEIRDIAMQGAFGNAGGKGKVERRDAMDDYIKMALSMVDVQKIKPFRIVIDAGNGMAGKIIPNVAKRLPCRIIPLYFELDGSFPNHPANPALPENLADLQKAVVREKADFGIAFDGDADRMFVVDDSGEIVGSSIITAIVAKKLLEKNPESTILYNLQCSKIVPETIEANGGKGIMTPVGTAIIKLWMKKYDALFAGEVSGHYFFRENYYADSGLIAALLAIELASEQNRPFSEIVKPLRKYAFIEGRAEVRDKKAKMQEIEDEFRGGADKILHLDGISMEFDGYWFNVRPSNTEPLLRYTIEADTSRKLEEVEKKLVEILQRKE